MESLRTSMNRSSAIPQRLTRFAAASFPAACATINSVPPAMGVHLPGESASNSSTADRLPGATRRWASALPRNGSLPFFAVQRGLQHGIEDANEPSAAAEISRQRLANLG